MARKELIGKVVSTYKNTVVVIVISLKSHPLYLKQVKKVTRLYAQGDDMRARVGDVVRIVETRPLSKLKRWRIVEVVSGGEE